MSQVAGDSILIINNSIDAENQYLANKVLEAIGSKGQIIHFTQTGKINFDNFSSVIIGGAPKTNNDKKSVRIGYYDWLRGFNKPVLGICAGHHLIGAVFGAEKKYEIESETGSYSIRIVKKDRIFAGLPSPFSALEKHHNSIKLPKDFILLASSDSCEVEAIRHKDKLIYGVQFHPELSVPQIIKNFVSLAI